MEMNPRTRHRFMDYRRNHRTVFNQHRPWSSQCWRKGKREGRREGKTRKARRISDRKRGERVERQKFRCRYFVRQNWMWEGAATLPIIHSGWQDDFAVSPFFPPSTDQRWIARMELLEGARIWWFGDSSRHDSFIFVYCWFIWWIKWIENQFKEFTFLFKIIWNFCFIPILEYRFIESWNMTALFKSHFAVIHWALTSTLLMGTCRGGLDSLFKDPKAVPDGKEWIKCMLAFRLWVVQIWH